MTLGQFVRLSLEGGYPPSILFEMRHGLGRLLRKRLATPVAPPADRPRVTRAQIRDALSQASLSPGDAVFVHSGIGNLGVIEGGRRAVFEALLEGVDPARGTLLFPEFSFHPRMFDFLESSPVFDVRSAPSYMGSLSQYALGVAGGARSIHPTHSVLAIGREAEWLTSAHAACATPFAAESPFQRFLALERPKILLIGVSTDVVTHVHAVEDRLGSDFPITVYLRKPYRIDCLDHEGRPLRVETRCHTPVLSLAREITRFDRTLREDGILTRQIPVGAGAVASLDAKRFCASLEQHARAGRTVYGTVRRAS